MKNDIKHSILNPTKKSDIILLEIYRKIYSAIGINFDDLINDGDIIDRQVDIHFDRYEMNHEVMMGIINRVLIDRKVRKIERQRYINTILLGCSPRTI